VRIADAEENQVVRIAGVVRAAGRTLRSKLEGESCVYWDVRKGVASAPEEHEACAFWLEDTSGAKALVRAEGLVVDVRAELAQQLVEMAEADIEVVSQRIRTLKDDARGGGPKQAEANRERRRLAKVATLLCAIRAEARGNVHVGGNLQGQRQWIEKNRHLAGDDLGGRTVQRMVERFEVLLREGDPIEVEGLLRREPMPAELGGGYRDRSDGFVLAPDASGVVRVRGVGTAAPMSEPELRKAAGLEDPVDVIRRNARRTKWQAVLSLDPIVLWTLLIVGVAVGLTLALR
jgi:hypothetical protein